MQKYPICVQKLCHRLTAKLLVKSSVLSTSSVLVELLRNEVAIRTGGVAFFQTICFRHTRKLVKEACIMKIMFIVDMLNNPPKEEGITVAHTLLSGGY